MDGLLFALYLIHLHPFWEKKRERQSVLLLLIPKWFFPKALRVTVHLGFQNVLLQQALVLPFISQKKALHVL